MIDRYVLLGSAALAVSMLPSAAASQAIEATPPPSPAPAVAQDDPDQADIIVTGIADREGLRKLDASFSISSASEEAIRRVQPTSTADLLKIVPGVWVETAGGASGANIFIRGFPSGGDAPYLTVQVDGAPLFPPPTLSFLENSSLFRIDDSVERVEVLRGGPSPIFSNGQPGATANFILKKGSDVPQLSLRGTYGTEGQYRGDVVASGPLAANTTYMIGGFYRVSDGLRNTRFPADKGGQFTASITHEFDGGGTLSVYGRYLDDKNAFYTATPLMSNNGKIESLPGFDAGRDTLIGNEIRNVTIQTGRGTTRGIDLADGRGAKLGSAGMSLDFALGDFQVSNKAAYLQGKADTRALFTGAAPVSIESFIAGRVTAANGAAATLAAAGRAATGGTATFTTTGGAVTPGQQVVEAGIWSVDKTIESFNDELRVSRRLFEGNTLTLGGYFAAYSSRDLWFLGNNILLALEPNARRIDVRLNNGVIATRQGFTGAPFFDVSSRNTGHNYAVYLADEWKVTPALRVDGGLRWERQDASLVLQNNDFGVDLDGDPRTLYDNSAAVLNGTYRTVDYSADHLAWTAGATYSITDRLNVFGRANSGFAFPQFDNLREGQTGTQTVKQYELGVKTSTRIYDIYLTGFYNRFRGLPFQQFVTAPDGSQSILSRIGGSRAYGLEFDGAIRPVRGFQIAARGVWQNAKYQDFGANTGNDVARQPNFLVAVTPSYRVETGMGEINLFGTYTHIVRRLGDIENLQPLPGYDTLDLGVSLDVGNFSIQAKVENVANTIGLTEGNARLIGAGATNGVFLGRSIFGRHGTISAAYKF